MNISGTSEVITNLALILVFTSMLSADQHELQDETGLVAAQIHRLAGKTWDEVAQELDRFKAAGFNALIFRVFQNRHDRYHEISGLNRDVDEVCGVYFQTPLACTPLQADTRNHPTEYYLRSGH